MRYHEFDFKRELESLQRAERQDLQGLSQYQWKKNFK